MEQFVEIYFEHVYEINKNVLTKEQVDLLQAVCSKELKFRQLSKRHMDKEQVSFYNDEDDNHPDKQALVDKYLIETHTNIVPLHRLIALSLPIKFSITCTVKEAPEYNIEETILHKLLSLESKLSQFDQGLQFNQKVGVHISDLGLLSVREVTWLEDACTQELQRHLDDGWRILSVCPQSDSRRPDYILGRNNKEN